MNSQKILVTGGTGFLGSYITRALVEHGYTVRVIRRQPKPLPWIPASVTAGVEWVDGDVLDVVSLGEAMEGMDGVIHAAAVVSFVKKDRAGMYQVNVEGTANVVNTALEKNIPRLVHISSVAAVGRSASGGRVNEEKKWEQSPVNTHYAISKHKAELHVWRGIAEGLDAVILNPSTILGYGDWQQGSCAIFKQVHDGFTWYTQGVNGFVDVEDTATLTRLIWESGIRGERFIINGDTWSFKKLQDTIADAFRVKRPSKAASPFLLSVARRLEAIRSFFTGHSPLLTRESARVAVSKTWFENDKIRKAFPDFTFTPLEDCIQKACEKYAAAAK